MFQTRSTDRQKRGMGMGFLENRQAEEAKETLKYWFLIDREVVKAISKGNYGLLDLAKARVEFLLKVLDPKLVLEGLKGEDEALWDIQSFLHNSGWWSRADNLTIRDAGKSRGKSWEQMVKSDSELIKFIQAIRNLVHPNTLLKLDIKDNESIRTALNQIHYGSLKVSRQFDESKRAKDNIKQDRKKVNT